MNRARTIGLSIIAVLAAIALIAGGGWYVYQQQNYVTTSDASVQGTLVELSAPADGTLRGWSVPVGAYVANGQNLGRVDGLTGSTDIPAPISGTVVQDNAVDREVVVPGEPLGYLINLNNLQIVAYVPEAKINHVAVGKQVDITVDAYPHTQFTGTVSQIGTASAVVAQGLPNTNLSGNFTKQAQRVPVYISIAGTEGKKLLPGMSAGVAIHRN